MVTLAAGGREPLFGRLVGGVDAPRIELSAIGRVVEACWREIPAHFPAGPVQPGETPSEGGRREAR